MKYKYTFVWKGQLRSFDNEDKNALLADVSAYLNKNNINFTQADLSKAIDRQSKLTPTKKKLALRDVVAGANAVIRYMGGSSVSNDEIIRRSFICEGCPLIEKIGGCGPCGAAGKISSFVNNVRQKMGISIAIPNQTKNSYCGICGCSLALLVVTRKENFHKESSEENSKRPDRCWLKETSTNFTNE
jgi:hypothetical protein